MLNTLLISNTTSYMHRKKLGLPLATENSFKSNTKGKEKLVREAFPTFCVLQYGLRFKICLRRLAYERVC